VLLVIGAVSILGHAVVVTVVSVREPDMAQLASQKDPEWVVSCESDAALATSARMGLCASPFRRGTSGGACLSDSFKQLEIDLVRCRANPEEVTELIDIKQLDPTPKPLMPDVAPVEDVVAAQLIEKKVEEKLEQAQKQMSRPDPNAQVVEITKPETEKIPDKARYLSEFDSSVEKQTVARGSTEKMVERPAPREMPPNAPKNPEKPEPPDAKEEQSKSTVEGPGQGPGEPAPSKLSMRGPGDPSDAPPADPNKPGEKSGQEVATADGIATRRGDGGRQDQRAFETQPHGGPTDKPGGGGGPPKMPNLRPTEDLLERAVGGGSVDHVEDADEGDFTALNSRKWKYATFFNRMKRQVAQSWHPDQVYLRRDPTGNIYGTRDRLTILNVSLKPDGAVAKIYVAKQSGVDFLDDEAVRAFREAQPFPNPPAGLVDTRSNLITFSFGFHFGIGGDASRWKVFRYDQ
jgi:TonB family protein